MDSTKEEFNGVIYKATNIVNQKVYIGQTAQALYENRKRSHKHNAINGNGKAHFAYSIRRYGWDAFQWQIIDTAQTQKELDEKEVYWIAHYDATNKEKGYNSTKGGQGARGFKHNEKFKKALIKRNNSKEFRLRISKIIDLKPFYAFNQEGKLVGEYQVLKWCSDELDLNYSALVNHYHGLTNNCGNYIIIKKEDYTLEVLEETLSKAWQGFAGTNNARATINEEQAREIIKLYNDGLTKKEIKKIFPNVSSYVISKIRTGESWTHLEEKINLPKKRELKKEEIIEIKKLLMQGFTQKEIAKRLKVSAGSVSMIFLEKTYEDVIVKGFKEWKNKQDDNTILKEEDVVQIRKMIMENIDWKYIQKKFDISETTIFEISRNGTWKHIQVEGWIEYLDNKNQKKRDHEKNIKKIKKMLVDGVSRKEIAKAFNVKRNLIDSIAQEEVWRNIYVDGWNEYQEKRKMEIEKANLSKEQVFQILDLVDKGYKRKEIVKITGVPIHLYKALVNKKINKYQPFIQEYYREKPQNSPTLT